MRRSAGSLLRKPSISFEHARGSSANSDHRLVKEPSPTRLPVHPRTERVSDFLPDHGDSITIILASGYRQTEWLKRTFPECDFL